MQLTGLDLLFWAAGFFLHLVLLFVLLLRHRYPAFPAFSLFVVANLIRTIALYFVHSRGNKSLYFDTFWALATVDTALQLCVVYEAYFNTFRPLGMWANDVRHAFLWLISVSILIAASLSWLASPPNRFWIQAVVIRGSLFSSVWIGELLIGMVWLSISSGLPWKTHVARISTGLGGYSLCDVVIETARTYFGVSRDSHVYTELSHVRMCVYLCCVVFWIATLWSNSPPSYPLSARLRAELAILQKMVAYDLHRIRTRRQG